MQNASRLSKAKVGIVGAGPCGMTLAMLLKRLGVSDFTLFESKSKDQVINSHPAAHYVNSRSMEIFGSLGELGTSIRGKSEELERFRYYRYCRRIGGLSYQVTDQLSKGTMESLALQSKDLPVHIPQNRLCQLMLSSLEKMGASENLKFSSKVEKLINNGDRVI
jgi:2-polyprenyl-6-methoxyphenol hydroxylase-like FAD-dependent oxidoreductase